MAAKKTFSTDNTVEATEEVQSTLKTEKVTTDTKEVGEVTNYTPKIPVAPEITFTESHVSRRVETLKRLSDQNPDFEFSFVRADSTKYDLNRRELVTDSDGNRMRVGNDLVACEPKAPVVELRKRLEERSFQRSPFGSQGDDRTVRTERISGPPSAQEAFSMGEAKAGRFTPKSKAKKKRST